MQGNGEAADDRRTQEGTGNNGEARPQERWQRIAQRLAAPRWQHRQAVLPCTDSARSPRIKDGKLFALHTPAHEHDAATPAPVQTAKVQQSAVLCIGASPKVHGPASDDQADEKRGMREFTRKYTGNDFLLQASEGLKTCSRRLPLSVLCSMRLLLVHARSVLQGLIPLYGVCCSPNVLRSTLFIMPDVSAVTGTPLLID